MAVAVTITETSRTPVAVTITEGSDDPIAITLTEGLRGSSGEAGPAPSGTGIVSVTAGTPDTPSTLRSRVAADPANLRTDLGLGTTDSPTFAGVTTTGTINAPSLTSDGSLSISSGGVDQNINYNPSGNGQNVFGNGNWAFQNIASGAGSLILNNGSSDSPNVKFSWAANKNFAIDTAQSGAFGGLSAQFLRFIKQSDESGGAVIAGLDEFGNFALKGSLYATSNLTASGTVSTGAYTVATLPTPSAGMRAYVTDASVAAAGNFGTTVAAAGGGTEYTVPVFYDGSNWIIA